MTDSVTKPVQGGARPATGDRRGRRRKAAEGANAAPLLADGVNALGVALPENAESQMLAYLELLLRWNRAHNLTRIVEWEDMVRLHLLDSLTVLPFLRAGNVLDIGTGAGLPGLILAIAEPERQFVLLDAAQKRTLFCRHAAATLGLNNVEVVHARTDEYQPDEPIETIVCRALATLKDLVHWTAHLRSAGARLVAMKGKHPAAEVEELDAMGENATIHPVQIPGLDVERHIVTLAQ